mgnify:CR=1 FL=1
MNDIVNLDRKDYSSVENETPFDIEALEQGKQLQFNLDNPNVSRNALPEIIDVEVPKPHEQASLFDDNCSLREDDGQARTGRLVGPLKYIVLENCTSTARLVEMLSRAIPLNQYSLPEYIYRVDCLDTKYFTNLLQSTTTISFPPDKAQASNLDEATSMLESAIVHFKYTEGFPAFENGMPFWQQLSFEPDEAYRAFVEYLELGGARQIHKLISYDIDIVNEYFHTFYWNWRVVAFDLYRAVHHQRQKIQRMITTEDDHYIKSQRFFKKVTDWLEKANLDDEELGMTPEKAVNMMEKLVKIQRISVGLTATGESKESTTPRPETPVNVLVQTIGNTHVSTKHDDDEDLDDLYNNPDAIEHAQSMIIEMQKSSMPRDEK